METMNDQPAEDEMRNGTLEIPQLNGNDATKTKVDEGEDGGVEDSSRSSTHRRKRKRPPSNFEPRRSVRETRKVKSYQHQPLSTRKEARSTGVLQGSGDALGCIESFDAALTKLKSDSRVLMDLHRLTHKVLGTRAHRKSALRQWKGVPGGTREVEKARIEKYLNKMTKSEMKGIATLFGFSAIKKSELVSQIAEFLVCPDMKLCKANDRKSRRRRSSSQKSPSSSKTGSRGRPKGSGRQKKRRLQSGKELTAFDLFAEERGSKMERKTATESEVTDWDSRMRDEWEDLTDSERKEFERKAAEMLGKRRKSSKGSEESKTSKEFDSEEEEEEEENEEENEEEENEEEENEGESEEEDSKEGDSKEESKEEESKEEESKGGDSRAGEHSADESNEQGEKLIESGESVKEKTDDEEEEGDIPTKGHCKKIKLNGCVEVTKDGERANELSSHSCGLEEKTEDITAIDVKETAAVDVFPLNGNKSSLEGDKGEEKYHAGDDERRIGDDVKGQMSEEAEEVGEEAEYKKSPMKEKCDALSPSSKEEAEGV